MSFIKSYRLVHDIKSIVMIHYNTIDNHSASVAIKVKISNGVYTIRDGLSCSVKFDHVDPQKCDFNSLIPELQEIVNDYLKRVSTHPESDLVTRIKSIWMNITKRI